jgi:hypothetical protein
MKLIISIVILSILAFEESKHLLNHSKRHSTSSKQNKKEKAKLIRIFFSLRKIASLASLSYYSDNREKLEKKLKKPGLEKWNFVDSVYNQDDNAGAFVVIDPTSFTLVISIKGTDNLWNGILDLNGLLNTNLNDDKLPNGAGVHSGFFNYFNSLISDEGDFIPNHYGNLDKVVNEGIRQLYLIQGRTASKSPAKKKYFSLNFIVTGHSLGGASATLYAYHLMSKGSNLPVFKELQKNGWHYNLNEGKIRLYTFGSPRVGNQIFANYLDNLIGKNHIFTVQYMSDPVTAIPPENMNYRHVGIIYLCFEPSEEHKKTYSCSISHDHSISIQDKNILEQRKKSWLKFWNRITFGDHGIDNGYKYIGLSPQEYQRKKEYEASVSADKNLKKGIIDKAFDIIKGTAKFISPTGNFIKQAAESLPEHEI